ncbi:MAG: hypothetical protein H7836_17365 [Magnetococcus sp. YQC-3]
MYFTIRIDDDVSHSPSTLDRLTDFLQHHRYIKYLVYREVSAVTKKLHYQGIVEIEEKTRSSHRMSWCNTFRDYSKGHKSTAIVKKLDEYMIYITKDKDKVLSKGYTDEEIEELQSKSYKKKTGRAPRPNDLYDIYMEYLLEQPDVDTKKYDLRWMSDNLHDLLTQKKMPIKFYQYYRSLIFNVQARIIYKGPKDEKLIEKCKEKFYLNIF